MELSGHTVVYGGSFNPPHVGHQMTCLYLLEALGAKAVWMVPACRHPFGKPLSSFAHRAAMLQAMSRPFADHVQVLAVEEEEGATGRTYDTLVSLKARHPAERLALAVGSDILREAAHWYRWADIEAMIPIVVVARMGFPADRATPVVMPEVSSADIRQRLGRGEAIDGLVPTAVAEYIERHRLYRG